MSYVTMCLSPLASVHSRTHAPSWRQVMRGRGFGTLKAARFKSRTGALGGARFSKLGFCAMAAPVSDGAVCAQVSAIEQSTKSNVAKRPRIGIQDLLMPTL